jgi:pyruvate ferredoxin oxidoreductase gamma subunit
MIEVRFHGRGGQGAVTAASLLAKAAGLDGKYAQGFPAFGVERRGAPVKAFARISEEPVRTRSQVYSPDYIVVLDPTLLGLPEITQGLKKGTVAVVNAANPSVAGCRAYGIDATSLALDILGKDIVNTAMLGAFAKASMAVSLESLLRAVEANFPRKLADPNTRLVKEAYERTKA